MRKGTCMADVLDWQNRSSQNAIIKQAVTVLTEGKLVVFPTDSGYSLAASALSPAAVERLAGLRQSTTEPLTLALASPGQALDWVPTMSPLGRRLTRRCWPGPLILQFGEIEHGLASRLPELTRQRLCPEGTVALYVPEHDAITRALWNLPAPLVLSIAAPPDEAREISVDQLQQTFGRETSLIIAAGLRPVVPVPGPSLVLVNGHGWTMQREGAIPSEEVARNTACVILFVCTGNTCRSPMAAALCNKLLAERLHCSPQELPQRGYRVLSAGLAAVPDDPATPEAIKAVEELGADLTGHASRPLTADLLTQADHVLTMTQGHMLALASRFARLGCRPRLLDPAGRDISDPVGGDQEVYRECARQMLQHLEKFLPELPIP